MVRMPALLTKMSSVPKASVVLATAARSSLAEALSAASRRTMPAPIPLEPPVTRATLPLNDFVCIWPPKPPGHALCHIMDYSVQNEHSAGAAHIRANGQNDEIICIGNLCPAPGKTTDTRAWFIRLSRRD